jgi:hypothetical protein
MAQFIPHGAIRAADIGFGGFILLFIVFTLQATQPLSLSFALQ